MLCFGYFLAIALEYNSPKCVGEMGTSPGSWWKKFNILRTSGIWHLYVSDIWYLKNDLYVPKFDDNRLLSCQLRTSTENDKSHCSAFTPTAQSIKRCHIFSTLIAKVRYNTYCVINIIQSYIIYIMHIYTCIQRGKYKEKERNYNIGSIFSKPAFEAIRAETTCIQVRFPILLIILTWKVRNI